MTPRSEAGIGVPPPARAGDLPDDADDPDAAGRAHRARRVSLRSACSNAPDADTAVRSVAAELGDDADLYLVFVPDGYELERAAAALNAWVGDRLVACTSAGAIGRRGFARDDLVAVALTAPDLTARTIPITPLSDLDGAWSRADPRLREALADAGGRAAFGILLIDGLSRREEAVAAVLADRLGPIPLVGGSAGDGLRFERTCVLVGDRFVEDAATLTLVTTSAAFRRFRLQHHVAGDAVLVVTGATPEQRLVHTLNGRIAVHEYARVVGVDVEELTPAVFSTYPLLLRAGGGDWVRSISQVEPDGSLRFFCSAEPGAVLRLARSTAAADALSDSLRSLHRDLGTLAGILVFDCILRRLEFEERGMDDAVGRVLAEHGAAGFSTYGEQFDGVHVNQTMVGIAFGG